MARFDHLTTNFGRRNGEFFFIFRALNIPDQTYEPDNADQAITIDYAGTDYRAVFVGYVAGHGDPIFRAPMGGGGHFEFLLTNRDPDEIGIRRGRSTFYPAHTVTREAWPPVIEFTNYGFRQGENLDNSDFDLQGPGPGPYSGLDIPDGVYRAGDTLTIGLFGDGEGAGGAVNVTFVGYVIDDIDDGDFYPIFEAANFNGKGRAQFIGTDETGEGDYTAGQIIRATFAVGEPDGAEFSNYGFLQGGDLTGEFTLRGAGLDIPDGAYRVGDTLTIQPFGNAAAVEVTFVGHVVSTDGTTNYPVFETADFVGNGPARFIGTNEPDETATYTYTSDDLVTDTPYATGFVSFDRYAFRQGNGIFFFQTRGDTEVDIRIGFYEPGNADQAISISYLGVDFEPVFIGYVAGHRDPVFRAVAPPGFGEDFEFILTNMEVPVVGRRYPAHTVIRETWPPEVTFANYGFRQGENLDNSDFDLQGTGFLSGLDVEDGVYRAGQALTIRPFGGVAAGSAVDVTFVGYVIDDGDFYPVFEAADFGGNGRTQFIGTDEMGDGDYTAGQIIRAAFAVGESPDDGTVEFSNYGFRQEADLTGEFTLRGAGLDIPDGAYRVGDTLTIQPFGDAGAVEVTFVGHVVSTGGTNYPVFEAADFGGNGPARFIGTNEPDATALYTPGALVTDTPYATGFASFDRFAFRQAESGSLEVRETEADIRARFYEPGNADQAISLRLDGVDFEPVFIGYVAGHGDPVFSAPAPPGLGTADFEFILTNRDLGTGRYPEPTIIREVWPPLITFANYGFRQGENLDNSDFDLQGTGPFSGLVIPDGVYEEGETLTIQLFGGTVGGSAVDVTYRGHVIDDGDFYPIFEAADFGGNGRTQFIGTDETGSGDYTAGQIIRAAFAVGEPPDDVTVEFSNYGFRQEDDLTGEFTLRGAGLDIPDGLYRVGETLTIQPFGDAGAVEVTFRGHVVSTGGTNYPVFEAADFGGNGPARFIGTNEPDETATYTYTSDDLVTDTPYATGFTSFDRYAFRQGNGIFFFNRRGDTEVDIRTGIYEPGNADQAISISYLGIDFEPVFVGYVAGYGDPVFRAVDPPGFGEDFEFILTNREVPSGSRYPAHTVIREAWPPLITFANYGFRRDVDGDGDFDDEGAFDLQGTGPFSGLDIPDGLYRVGDTLTIQIFGDGAGAAGTVDVTYVGHVIEDGDFYPIFEAADFGGNGRTQFIGTDETGSGDYTAGQIIRAAFTLGEPPTGVTTEFSNYGFRQEADLTGEFTLRGAGLDIPEGAYRVGDPLTIQLFGRAGAVDVTFVGHVVSADGTEYPVFEAADFGGDGPARFIGTNEPDETALYTPGALVTDTSLGLGVVRFADYGLRRPGGSDVLNSQFSRIEFDRDVHDVRDIVELRILRSNGAVQETITAEFAGYDRETGDPLFSNPRQQNGNPFGGGRQIIAASERARLGTYNVPREDIVAESWPPAPADAEFSNYGIRQGNLTGDFDLQGTGPSFGLVIPDGVYEAGNTLTIRPFGGAAAGLAVDVTYRGYVIDDSGDFYPIFEAADFNGRRTQFIGTRETGSGDYTPGQLVTDTPLEIGDATFDNFGTGGNEDGTGAYTLDGNAIGFAQGVYKAGDQVVLTAPGEGTTRTWTGTFVGFENLTGNPIFRIPASEGQQAFSLIATNGPGTGTFTVPDGGVITAVAYETDETYGAGTVTFSMFGNHGTRQGDADGDFALQEQGVAIVDGFYGVGFQAVLHVSGQEISTRYVGYVVDGGQFNPVFRDGAGLHYIGTNETGSGDYTPGTLTADSFVFGEPSEPTFSNYGFRQGGNLNLDGEFTLRGAGIDIPDNTYQVGATLTIQPFGGGGAVDVTYLGYVVSTDGTNYPVFEAADFGGDGPARFIATNETGTGSYSTTSDDLVEAPYNPGLARFTNLVFLFGDGDGDYTFTGNSIDIRAGIWAGGDTLSLTHDGTDYDATLWGFHTVRNYPIFVARTEGVEGGDFYFMLTDEPVDPNAPVRNQFIHVGDDDVTIVADPDGNPLTPAVQYMTCFAPGTLIATPGGERAVETLKPGEEVRTADGGVATVRFVGMQKVSTIFAPREVTHPVRILAGALGENVPHTDLVVTKDHGMILDGIICNAGALINGTSIAEVPTHELDTDSHGVVTYYHVETESHAVLLANGAAAESFIDTVDRAAFSNYSEFVAMYGPWVPDMTEMNLPRAMSIRQLPDRIRWRLSERAETIRAPVAQRA